MIPHKWFGLVNYHQGEEHQETCFEQVLKGEVGQILGFEFHPVITLGKRAELQEDLKLSKKELQSEGVEVAEIERGGHATLHSPGQLVIYPVVNLQKNQVGVKEYIALLEETTQETLENFGVLSFKRQEPGLYTQVGKIAFLGLRIRSHISTHGLSINICNQLSYFSKIKSCGVAEEQFDCVSNYSEISLDDFFEKWVQVFNQKWSEEK